ncbi:hypothetical protein D9613_004626 [Agrocybe pediades]|uniref:Uncharacterized protein n=1 Tax=Agrocybe pediades TaxID=84607 RepID=A0A8H4VJP5_9AGAR|nr:hypothetical protein D9613_004626 [Agrocybe pediades]
MEEQERHGDVDVGRGMNQGVRATAVDILKRNLIMNMSLQRVFVSLNETRTVSRHLEFQELGSVVLALG